MNDAKVEFTVFSKPWKMPLAELGKFVKDMGFSGIELPVRPEYQVLPESVSAGLPEAAKILADCGIRIGSVAGPTDEATIAACGKAGVGIIRTMVDVPKDASYMDTMHKAMAGWEKLVPALDAHGVTIGVQNHCNRQITSAMGLRYVAEKFDPKHVGAVLDFGHSGLAGEPPDMAIDIVGRHLCLVNLKSAYWTRTNGPEADTAAWSTHWTTGRHGQTHWPTVANELKKSGYQGDICITAEYSDHDQIDRFAAEDVAFVKSLF